MGAYLGIDTSNYTTSLSLSEGGKISKNLRKLLAVKEGERGLRQSDALFAHTVNLPSMFDLLGQNALSAVGGSATPRDCEGSYMPCFLAGVSAASGISSVLGIPLYRFSHQAGHIAAALYSCGREDLHHGKFLAFHVSGGTTEVLHVDNGHITLIGGTADISAGQAIDRIGVMLGLSFPCGKELEQLAGDFCKVKAGKTSVNGCNCNLSGLENKVAKMLSDGVAHQEIAAFTLSFVSATLVAMTENALMQYPDLPIVYGGGVMSNKFISSELGKRFDAYFAKSEFSCDNAAGTARLTELKHTKQI